MELSAQTPSGVPMENGWSWVRPCDEVRHVRHWLPDDAPPGVFGEADEEAIPF